MNETRTYTSGMVKAGIVFFTIIGTFITSLVWWLKK